MKAVLFPIAFLAAAASAQSSACAADYILEACIGTISGQLAACDSKDWGCQCTQYEQYVTCFNNCPNDERKHTYEGQQQIFCGYASQYPSSTIKPVSAAVTTTTSTTPTDAAQEVESTSAGASTSATSTGSAASASKTNSAADLALNAGGILAAVAGVVAAVL